MIVEYSPAIESYLELKENFRTEEVISMNVQGSFWLFAKNGVHSKTNYSLANLFDSHIDFATDTRRGRICDFSRTSVLEFKTHSH